MIIYFSDNFSVGSFCLSHDIMFDLSYKNDISFIYFMLRKDGIFSALIDDVRISFKNLKIFTKKNCKDIGPDKNNFIM